MCRNISILLAGAIICLCFAACGEPVNLALKKAVVASSSGWMSTHDGNKYFSPEFAVDGNLETRWASNFQGDADPEAAWIFVDLGQKTEFKLIRIFWSGSYAEELNIEVSDDTATWQVVTEVKTKAAEFTQNGRWSNIRLDKPVAARYIKMNGKKPASKFGYSLFEFEIY
jgi:hypothetical protein